MRKTTWLGIAVAAVMTMGLAVPATGQTLTKQNWTEGVGFKPSEVPGFKPGLVLDGSSWKKFQTAIPDEIGLLMEKYGLKIWTSEYRRVHPSLSYIEATNKYHKNVSLIDTGNQARKRGIEGYTAGLPFPQPKDGLEVAWNYHYAYNGDDGGFHYGVYWISGKNGVERSEEWRWLYIIRAMNRTDQDPRPHMPEFESKGISYASMTWAVEPYDKAGFGALYYRYVEPKDQEGWIYIPTMRRTMKATFGTRGDAWNSTDMLYEDVRGYMGYPEWMNWKLIGKKTMLAPVHSGVRAGKQFRDQTFDFKNPPHWNFRAKWEPRPVYVVEATPKFKDYPYSRMVFYFDAETFYIPYKVAFDKKGQLWKVLINAMNDSPNMDVSPLTIGTSLVIDLQSEHATAFPSYNFTANTGLKASQFTLGNLRKMAK
jgi:hypothetical protein